MKCRKKNSDIPSYCTTLIPRRISWWVQGTNFCWLSEKYLRMVLDCHPLHWSSLEEDRMYCWWGWSGIAACICRQGWFSVHRPFCLGLSYFSPWLFISAWSLSSLPLLLSILEENHCLNASAANFHILDPCHIASLFMSLFYFLTYHLTPFLPNSDLFNNFLLS